MLSAEVPDEALFDQESEEVASVEKQEISYLSDGNGGYVKRPARPAKDAPVDEDDDDEEPVCRPRARPQPKPQCAPKPKCRPPVMYKSVTKRVRCCDRKEMPEACAGLMFPSAHESMLQCGADINLFGEWLYYKISEAGLVYTTNQNVPSNVFTMPTIIRPIVMQPGYDSGFRVGFDAEINSDNWKLIAAWTRFHHTNFFSQSLQTLPADNLAEDNLSTNFYYPVGGISRSIATASWKFHYDILDVLLGRDCYLGKKLFIQPYAGFRGALVIQEVNASYYNPPPTGNFFSTGTQTFRGAGLKFGADLHWMFARRLGLYTDISSSLLWATYKTHITNSYSLNTGPALLTPMNVDSLQSILEMGVGLELDTYFACDRYHLTLRAGWEESLWLEHNHLFQAFLFADGASNRPYTNGGALSLSGAVAGIKLGF